MSKLCSFTNLPEELKMPVSEISDLLPFYGSAKITVARCEKGFRVEPTADGVCISYARKCDFFRALTFVKRVEKSGKAVCQSAEFRTLCYMADLSRNAVMSMDGAKKMIRLLASMGYDSMMLYTEDTYEIPEYPYFGHMRGRYTQAQMKELDDYADSFGIELIPCVQTLAHLATALRWECFKDMKDNSAILLAGSEKVYDFIDAMMKSLSSCFRSRRVHVGMDEAHELGLGRYLDLHGYQNRFQILSDHLLKVRDICSKYGLEPMMWSDMFFRLFNHGGYYMKDKMLPADILDKVPEGVGLVYWDYYNRDEQMLDCMFKNHAAFGRPVWFAGGAWKWTGQAPSVRNSIITCRIHVNACLRNGCKDVIVTGWGDDGAEASQFSIIAPLAVYAEYCYDPSFDENGLSDRLNDCFGLSQEAFRALDLPNEIYDTPNTSIGVNPCKWLLFNAPLNGLCDAHIPDGCAEKYLHAANELLKYKDHPLFGYVYSSLAALSFVLEKKADLSLGIRRAYEEKKTDVLRWYAEKEIPEIIARIDDYIVLFRQQWYCENKTFGFDVQEIRLGGLKECLNSAAIRLKSYCAGETDCIEELEQPILPYRADADGNPAKTVQWNDWVKTVSAARVGGW